MLIVIRRVYPGVNDEIVAAQRRQPSHTLVGRTDTSLGRWPSIRPPEPGRLSTSEQYALMARNRAQKPVGTPNRLQPVSTP